MPKRLKFRKVQKGRRRNQGIAHSCNKLSFGSIGLKSLEHGMITSQQIESMRKVIVRYTQRGGKIWVRVFPHKPMTAKGLGVKLGKGVGEITKYVAPVLPGTMIVEMDGIEEKKAEEIFGQCKHKLPVKVKIVKLDTHI